MSLQLFLSMLLCVCVCVCVCVCGNDLGYFQGHISVSRQVSRGCLVQVVNRSQCTFLKKWPKHDCVFVVCVCACLVAPLQPAPGDMAEDGRSPLWCHFPFPSGYSQNSTAGNRELRAGSLAPLHRREGERVRKRGMMMMMMMMMRDWWFNDIKNEEDAAVCSVCVYYLNVFAWI